MLFGRANPGRSHISLSYRPLGRYLNTILEIIGYLNLLSPSAMPSGTTLKTPPSLRDTSSINRGGLKSFCSSFILTANAVVYLGGQTRHWHTYVLVISAAWGFKTISEIIGYLDPLRPSAMPSGTTLKTPPSLRDTSSINRGGLKSFCSSFILIANVVLLGQTHRSASTATALTPLSYRPYGRYLKTILKLPHYVLR